MLRSILDFIISLPLGVPAVMFGVGFLYTYTRAPMILYGTHLGDASKHVTTNLPTILAGGGFKHGQHLVFDRNKNYPLPNLFVSMLQRLGVETDRFASSTGTMRGMEMVG